MIFVFFSFSVLVCSVMLCLVVHATCILVLAPCVVFVGLLVDVSVCRTTEIGASHDHADEDQSHAKEEALYQELCVIRRDSQVQVRPNSITRMVCVICGQQ